MTNDVGRLIDDLNGPATEVVEVNPMINLNGIIKNERWSPLWEAAITPLHSRTTPKNGVPLLSGRV